MTNDDALRLCLDEAQEHLDLCDRAALALDEAMAGGACPTEALAALFRGVHTIKGNAGMLGLGPLVVLAHALETLLDGLRSGRLAVDRDVADLVFAGLDALRTDVVSRGRGVPPGLDHEAVAATLLAAATPGDRGAPDGWAERFPGWRVLPEEAAAIAAGLQDGSLHLYHLVLALPGADPAAPLAHPALEQLLALGRAAAWCRGPDDHLGVAWASAAEEDVVLRFAPPELVSCTRAPDGRLPSPPGPLAGLGGASAPAGGPAEASADATIRVGVALLDKLMNLVGELVLTRNQVLQLTDHGASAAITAPVQRLSQITTELQEAVMRTRMQPIGQLWEKFPRLVRDHGRQSGKLIALALEGTETELDKGLLEAIKDPLTHLFRNAMDHGIEPPEARRAAGKPEVGNIALVASQAGGTITIEVRDDGRGLNYDRIRAKALEAGLVPPEALARMAEAELAALVFLPGFSTAEAVTDLSGRGVGMDVVKTNLERIGGSVELISTPGQGTTTRLRIPLTLAVIPALVVRAGESRFALPQVAIHEVLRPGEADVQVERLREASVVRLRGELVPVVELREALGLPPAPPEVVPFLVVAVMEQRTFALAVDAIGDPEEIVVKALPDFIRAGQAYSGVTIMGDGAPCLILNLVGLAERAGLAAAVAAAPEAVVPEEDADPRELQRMLLVSIRGQRFAVPMALVSRLEDVEAGRVEAVGRRRVLQQGDRLLSLVDPALALGLPATHDAAAERVSIVVVGSGERAVGLRVDAILDFVAERRDLQAAPGVPGVGGSLVLAGRVTEVLDVAALVEAELPGWGGEGEPVARPVQEEELTCP